MDNEVGGQVGLDPDAEGVFLGDLEFDPAPPLGDDAAGVELLVAMGTGARDSR